MDGEAWQQFSNHVAFEGTLRVACEAMEAPLEPVALDHLNELNASVLNSLAALGERRHAGNDDESPLGLDMARLDAKLDVLMEVVNRALYPEAKLPGLHRVRLNAFGLQSTSLAPLAHGSQVRLALHFEACRALPLTLPGTVVATGGADTGFIAFDGLSDSVREGIERFVFRQHRRHIAETRQAAQNPAPPARPGRT